MLCLPLLLLIRFRPLWPGLRPIPRRYDEQGSSCIPIDPLAQ
jgi:hypothetical protein